MAQTFALHYDFINTDYNKAMVRSNGIFWMTQNIRECILYDECYYYMCSECGFLSFGKCRECKMPYCNYPECSNKISEYHQMSCKEVKINIRNEKIKNWFDPIISTWNGMAGVNYSLSTISISAVYDTESFKKLLKNGYRPHTKLEDQIYMIYKISRWVLRETCCFPLLVMLWSEKDKNTLILKPKKIHQEGECIERHKKTIETNGTFVTYIKNGIQKIVQKKLKENAPKSFEAFEPIIERACIKVTSVFSF